MRIDRTNPLGRPETLGDNDKSAKAASAAAINSANAAAGAGKGATVLSTKSSLLRRAAATPEIDAKAVAEARRLLSEGLLDTPQAAQAAAEAIISRGL